MKPFYRYVKLSEPCQCGSTRPYRECCFRPELVGIIAVYIILAALFFLPAESWLHRIVNGGIGWAHEQTTAARIIVGVLIIALFYGSDIRSLIVGSRHGLRIPRSLHWVSATVLMTEAVILVVFPVNIRTITPLLGTILVCLPVSPYAGWVMSGGPTRRRNEQMKQELTQQELTQPAARGNGIPSPQP